MIVKIVTLDVFESHMAPRSVCEIVNEKRQQKESHVVFS